MLHIGARGFCMKRRYLDGTTSAHVENTLWKKESGGVVFVDPQAGKVIPYEKIDDKAATDVIIARLDNAEPVAWNLPDVIQPFASM